MFTSLYRGCIPDLLYIRRKPAIKVRRYALFVVHTNGNAGVFQKAKLIL